MPELLGKMPYININFCIILLQAKLDDFRHRDAAVASRIAVKNKDWAMLVMKQFIPKFIAKALQPWLKVRRQYESLDDLWMEANVFAKFF